ncbi:MAG: hypothetical protein K0S41_3659 [Anaerocolumna sp.]|nr:hypothetical protein [Anaerocolumna sp.]
MVRKKVAIIGLIVCFFYFIATFMLILKGSSKWLITMEISTIIGGVYMVPFITVLPYEKDKINLKIWSLIATSSCMILTCIAHIVNLTVTNSLLASGVNVPDYFQIGKWPSVETIVDYTAWGFFLGLGFVLSAFAIGKNKHLKITVLICGLLCLLGYFSAIIFNPNLWYIAPMGYGIGCVVICIILIAQRNRD